MDQKTLHETTVSSQLKILRNDVLVLNEISNSNYQLLHGAIDEINTGLKKVSSLVTVSLEKEINIMMNEFHKLLSCIEYNCQKDVNDKVLRSERQIVDLQKSLQDAFQIQESRNEAMFSCLQRIENRLTHNVESGPQQISNIEQLPHVELKSDGNFNNTRFPTGNGVSTQDIQQLK